MKRTIMEKLFSSVGSSKLIFQVLHKRRQILNYEQYEQMPIHFVVNMEQVNMAQMAQMAQMAHTHVVNMNT